MSGEALLRKPITGRGCCARAVSGHVVAVPTNTLMNSRRLIASPEALDKASCRLKLAHFKMPGMRSAHVRFGSLADICGATDDVRFAPESDRESRHPEPLMSALPPKADMCGALAHFCYGPIADIAHNPTCSGKQWCWPMVQLQNPTGRSLGGVRSVEKRGWKCIFVN